MRKLLFFSGFVFILGFQAIGQTQSIDNTPKLKTSDSKIQKASSSVVQPQLKMKSSVKTLKPDSIKIKAGSQNPSAPKLQPHNKSSSIKSASGGKEK
jgi:hypothetical protein